MKIIRYSVLVLLIGSLSSCLKTQFEEVELTSGNANFTNYIAVGNSLTQGFQDNGLHNRLGEQSNSYPAIIAQQMKLVNPGMNTFKQPLVTGNGSGYVHLAYINGELEAIKPGEPGAYEADPSWSSWGDKNQTYNNLGIAGIRLADCVPTQGDPFSSTINQVITSNNPFGRFLDFGTTLINEVSYLDHVQASNATFFTCWLGNNDVLGWATNGGDDGEISIFGIPFPVKTSPLTDVTEFRQKYDAILDAFQSMGAKGICATLPDVSSIPFFNTVTKETVGVTDMWITEGDGTTVRKLAAGDLILLTALDSIEQQGEGLSQSKPLRHTYVLDVAEVQQVQNHTIQLNNEIKASAAAHGYGVVDMFSYLETLETSIKVDGIEFSTKFVEGGAFSLDGVHPNQRGYALVANKFIEAINQTYGSNIPLVDVGKYKGIIFP